MILAIVSFKETDIYILNTHNVNLLFIYVYKASIILNTL